MADKPKKDLKLEITELFMAKAGNDFSRCFYGTIKRGKSIDDTPFVFGKILVEKELHNAHIYSRANEQSVLGKKLDEFVLLILDNGLHDSIGISSKIIETDFFHN